MDMQMLVEMDWRRSETMRFSNWSVRKLNDATVADFALVPIEVDGDALANVRAVS